MRVSPLRCSPCLATDCGENLTEKCCLAAFVILFRAGETQAVISLLLTSLDYVTRWLSDNPGAALMCLLQRPSEGRCMKPQEQVCTWQGLNILCGYLLAESDLKKAPTAVSGILISERTNVQKCISELLECTIFCHWILSLL